MQKELADRLEIAKSNVAGWLQRGLIRGNVIVQCALDTGADVQWLVTGECANASYGIVASKVKGKYLYDAVMSTGGRPVLRRIFDAYGFTNQKQLCDLLGISSGTVSTWIRREFFLGDVVITCALDTGI
ncbi:helix-turn-helix domain-containing protein [Cedecea davisae]|uniref:helix-turn-helix domain-containing protein n=1 Tax=Cedecea davisae TaxID=158484 RepID=UPI00376EEA6B